MANEGHIMIKSDGRRKSYREAFFHPKQDKDKRGGYAARPFWTRQRAVADLESRVKRNEQLLTGGFIQEGENRQKIAERLREDKKQLDMVNEVKENVKKELETNGEFWQERRKGIKEFIGSMTPSDKVLHERMVSPHLIAKREKQELIEEFAKQKDGSQATFQDVKLEYIGISRAMGEDSDLTHIRGTSTD